MTQPRRYHRQVGGLQTGLVEVDAEVYLVGRLAQIERVARGVTYLYAAHVGLRMGQLYAQRRHSQHGVAYQHVRPQRLYVERRTLLALFVHLERLTSQLTYLCVQRIFGQAV